MHIVIGNRSKEASITEVWIEGPNTNLFEALEGHIVSPGDDFDIRPRRGGYWKWHVCYETGDKRWQSSECDTHIRPVDAPVFVYNWYGPQKDDKCLSESVSSPASHSSQKKIPSGKRVIEESEFEAPAKDSAR